MKRLDITYPKSVSLLQGQIKFNLDTPLENIFSIDNIDYIPYYLDNSKPGNAGGNGCVLKLISAQNYDEDEGYPETPDLVIKICKYYIDKFKEEHVRSRRFDSETKALVDCNSHNLPNLVPIYHYGEALINSGNNRSGRFRYYTMDYAEKNLSEYLAEKNLSLLERIELCIELCESLNQLWSRYYYHRDIKPDNILFIGDKWMISDLGLTDHRDQINNIDFEGEWIGPRGWMSPESMNKVLTEKKPWEYLFDSSIDHQSDIYQLGKVMWFILQGNSPEGGIRRIDFKWKNDGVYQILRTMINSSKSKRFVSIGDVLYLLHIERKRLVKSKTAEQYLYIGRTAN